MQIYVEFGNGDVSVGIFETKVEDDECYCVVIGALSKAYPLGEIAPSTEKDVPRDKIYLCFPTKARAIKALAGLVDKDEVAIETRWEAVKSGG